MEILLRNSAKTLTPIRRVNFLQSSDSSLSIYFSKYIVSNNYLHLNYGTIDTFMCVYGTKNKW